MLYHRSAALPSQGGPRPPQQQASWVRQNPYARTALAKSSAERAAEADPAAPAPAAAPRREVPSVSFDSSGHLLVRPLEAVGDCPAARWNPIWTPHDPAGAHTADLESFATKTVRNPPRTLRKAPRAEPADHVAHAREQLRRALDPECEDTALLAKALRSAETIGHRPELQPLRQAAEQRHADLEQPFPRYADFLHCDRTKDVAAPEVSRSKSLWRSGAILAVTKEQQGS